MKINPQQSRIVVEPIPNEDTTIQAVFIKSADNDSDRPAEAFRYRVVAVGKGRTLENGTVIPVPVQVGDEVRFDFRYAQPLFPETWYGGAENSNPPNFGKHTKFVVDYAGVLAVIERDPEEKVSRFNLPKQEIDAPKPPKPSILIPRHVAVG